MCLMSVCQLARLILIIIITLIIINLNSELTIFTTTEIPEANNGFCGQPGMRALCKAKQQQHRKCTRRVGGEGNQVTWQFVGGNKMPAARGLSAQK